MSKKLCPDCHEVVGECTCDNCPCCGNPKEDCTCTFCGDCGYLEEDCVCEPDEEEEDSDSDQHSSDSDLCPSCFQESCACECEVCHKPLKECTCSRCLACGQRANFCLCATEYIDILPTSQTGERQYCTYCGLRAPYCTCMNYKIGGSVTHCPTCGGSLRECPHQHCPYYPYITDCTTCPSARYCPGRNSFGQKDIVGYTNLHALANTNGWFEPLELAVVFYAQKLSDTGVNFFTGFIPSQTSIADTLRSYLYVIISEELRHTVYKLSNVQRPPFWLPMLSPPFPRSARYPRSLASQHASLVMLRTDEVISFFNRPGWSKGYGGRPWAELCKLLKIQNVTVFNNYVLHAAHCNGSIFNKVYEARNPRLEDEQAQAQRLTRFLTIVSQAQTPEQVLDVLKAYTAEQSYLGNVIRSAQLPKKENHAK